MTSDDIRAKFLAFFAARDHRVVRSSPLVPANDPTLLFTNAGMNQFKDVFLGREKRDYARAVSVQKCVRAGGKHNDLEQVGRTTRHHTFFEMLGNFSFGDYFKKEAIPWAWDLVTKDFAIPKEKLYVTVFREDDDAESIWAKSVGVPRDRIFRCDEKDNFWAMGETGPCGPCSEIHYDLGPKASDQGHTDCKFPCDCGRYVELWNLVFMQFNRDEQGKLTPLPSPSIDTGAGLERLATVLQGKTSNFDTDLLRPLIARAGELLSVTYGFRPDSDMSLRIIADHARAVTFLISDGIIPANEGRGYVLRKILRRAIHHGRLWNKTEPFLHQMVYSVRDIMKGAYPELNESTEYVVGVVLEEEKRFSHTLDVGLQELEDRVGDLKRLPLRDIEAHIEDLVLRGKVRLDREVKKYRTENLLIAKSTEELNSAAVELLGPQLAPELVELVQRTVKHRQTFPGEEAFKLYDTFGLPLDFIEDAVRDHGLALDHEGFQRAMAEQRIRARASWKAVDKAFAEEGYRKVAEKFNVTFLGYEQTKVAASRVLVVVSKEPQYPSRPGPQVEIVLDRTPFYAEAGGQVGDTGWLRIEEREVAVVEDTYSPIAGLVVHKVRLASGVKPEDFEHVVVTAEVDGERRNTIRRNHTGTHLLHAALRKTLGTHVKQAGSLVAPDRLRFDFTHYAGLGEQDLLDIEDLVNQHVLENEEVRTEVMDIDTAVNSGAMALFGEKYGDRVRVVSIADGTFSKELCGGTHVRRTGDIGLFKIISETSVAAGTRRIEALTGQGVLEYLRRASQTLAQAGEVLRAKPDEVLEAIEKLAESEKKLRKQLESQQLKRAASEAGDLVAQARDVKGVRLISARVDLTDRAALRQMVDSLRPKLGSGVIVLGSVADGKVALIAAVTQDLTNRLDAGKIVKQAAAIVEGTGGGRKDLAEAGGKNPDKLDESLAAVPSIVERML